MSDEIKVEEEVKGEKPAKAEKTVKVKAEEVPAAPVRSDGLVAFYKDGVTIRRPAEMFPTLEKAGWVKK